MKALVQHIKSRLEDFDEQAFVLAGRSPTYLMRKDGSHFEYPLLGHVMPALDFEERTKLSGVAGGYRYLPGLEAHEIENYALAICALARFDVDVVRECNERLPLIWTALKKLNPKLGAVRIDETDREDIYDAVIGVLSNYNPRDIEAYINVGHGIIRAKGDAYQACRTWVENNAGEMQWVPSYHTLISIKSQIEQRAQKKTGPSFRPV